MSHGSATGSSESRGQNDSVREAPSTRVEPATFTPSERVDLYKDFNSTVGSGSGTGTKGAETKVASNDANLPASLSFDNSIYAGVHGSGVSDSKLFPPAESQQPLPPGANTSERVYDQNIKAAEKFANGDTLTDAQAQEGKEKLKILTEQAFKDGGVKGLKDLAKTMSEDARDTYGDSAFDKAPSSLSDQYAKVQATENKDGSTQVQYDFAQPNSNQKNTVIYQIPKPAVGDGKNMEPYFPDGKPTKYI